MHTQRLGLGGASVLLASLCAVLLTSTASGAVELTNYRSGISLAVQGRNGHDYAVERFYHDPRVDDHGVIYLRSGTPLALTRNEFNTWQGSSGSPFKQVGVDGPDGKPDSGDEGTIRFKVDRDQQTTSDWSPKPDAAEAVCAPFVRPFCFAELEYEPGVKVLGSLGAKPGAAPGTGFYFRGYADAFGDEWHSLTVADDDRASHDPSSKPHMWASDGKVFLFVVDPQTPCLSLLTRTDSAQFYTTPAKTYFLPRLHAQTTFLTDGVDLLLTNVIDDRPMSYRVGQGDPRAYAAPLRSEDFADGPNVLEYWIDGGPHKTRTVIKNPPFPSAGEAHPRLLWADDAELTGIRARLQREPYKAVYEGYRTEGPQQAAIDAILGRGARNWVGGALANAFVARIEGPEAKTPTGTRAFASYAKQVLLDNKLCYDPVGLELSHNNAPMPTAEWNAYGYYVVNEVFDLALGYDLLISFYRADQAPGGITPIEDLKIRDALAHWTAVQTYEFRGFEGNPSGPQPRPANGMWDFARLCGAAVAAMAMPAYDTPYYGTSGFDGTTRARHQDLPFVGQAFTWKELFIDANQPLGTTPQLMRRFNHLEGGLVTEDGHFYDRSPYYGYPLMGHCFQILANVAALSSGKHWPSLDRSFARAEEGTLEGKKVNAPSDVGPKSHTQILLVNPRFPALAPRIRDRVQGQPATAADGTRNDNHIGFQLFRVGALGLIWYQDDIAPSL